MPHEELIRLALCVAGVLALLHLALLALCAALLWQLFLELRGARLGEPVRGLPFLSRATQPFRHR